MASPPSMVAEYLKKKKKKNEMNSVLPEILLFAIERTVKNIYV